LEKENAMNVRFRSIRVVAAALAFVAFLPTVALVFEDKRAFDEFTGGNFEFAAGVSAVAITAGASASAGTGGGEVQVHAEEEVGAARLRPAA
jgi:hypothetical protein